MSKPDFALVCSQPDCTYKPDLGKTVSEVEVHYSERHPDAEDYALTLVVTCPRDGEGCIFNGPDGQVTGKYSCPACMRTYVLMKNPME